MSATGTGSEPPPPPQPPIRGGSTIMRLLRDRTKADDGDGETPGAGHELDPLTGLPTRAALTPVLTAAIRASHKDSNVAVLAFVEAAELRGLNDVLGPDAGDELLRQIGGRLRSIDLEGTEVIRYEGAIFAVVLPSVPNVGGADTAAAFLIDLLSKPFEVGASRAGMGPIVGAAVSADNYRELDDMVRDAYHAMLAARDKGPGAFVVHDESKRSRYSTRIDDRRLHDAIEAHEFELHYQPIIDLADGRIAGSEALLRWLQPGATNSGMLLPHDFLPLLERSGQILEVTHWVLDEACRQLAAWDALGPNASSLFVSCNLSRHDLTNAELVQAVVDALQTHGVAPSRLGLDITEEALRHNRFQLDVVWARLRVLKDLGVRLALDDFGTGAASVDVLRSMQVDTLRIPRTFTAGIVATPEDRVLVKHMTAMGHDLGCTVIAEGIETADQQQVLSELGVDLGQGYQFGRPERPATMTERLRS